MNSLHGWSDSEATMGYRRCVSQHAFVCKRVERCESDVAVAQTSMKPEPPPFHETLTENLHTICVRGMVADRGSDRSC